MAALGRLAMLVPADNQEIQDPVVPLALEDEVAPPVPADFLDVQEALELPGPREITDLQVSVVKELFI
jgi:hypothetical protein